MIANSSIGVSDARLRRIQEAKQRMMRLIPVRMSDGVNISLSTGKHSQLIKQIIEEFAPRFAPGGQVVYVGDTGDKSAYFDSELLTRLDVSADFHGKMPDVIIYDSAKQWLLLIEAVTSHGPVNAKRHEELHALFAGAKAGLIFVTAFPTRRQFARYAPDISWETEVWIAESPDHLIHFDGTRFLGPYEGSSE
jgi:type II restriction enzyme